ncbi:MAG: hypothetical protein ABGW86_02410, partial [Candidatus Poseidoniia archaeon]
MTNFRTDVAYDIRVSDGNIVVVHSIQKQLLVIFLLSITVLDAQFALPTFQAAHKPHYSNYVLVLNGTNEHAYYADN